jgi:hypothetical protein
MDLIVFFVATFLGAVVAGIAGVWFSGRYWGQCRLNVDQT